MVSGDTISKWEMFVWISSHVPSAIALSLFILKSSNLDKINAPSDPNHSCGNVRLLIAYKLKLVLVPRATSEWSKVLRSFFNIVCYVHHALPTYSPWLPIFLHTVFVPYMGLSQHRFGNFVNQDGNNSQFSIRRELAWDRGFKSASVRLVP